MFVVSVEIYDKCCIRGVHVSGAAIVSGEGYPQAGVPETADNETNRGDPMDCYAIYSDRRRSTDVEFDRALHVHEGVSWDEWELVAVVEVAGALIRAQPDSGKRGALEVAGQGFTAESVLSGFVPEPCGLRILWWCSAHKTRFGDGSDEAS